MYLQKCTNGATDTGTHSKLLCYYRPVALFLLVAIIVAREPRFFTIPRFWAEEAFLYFANAYVASVWEGVFKIFPGQASLMLCTSLPATIAARVPMEWAPLVTTGFALLFYVVLFVTILYGRSRIWDTGYKRICACLMILGISGIADEVWLNTTNLQIFCGMFCVIMLAEDLSDMRRARKWAYRVLLLFGGLSGLYSSVLLPAFFIRWLGDRRRESLVQLATVAACAVFQGSVVIVFVFTQGVRAGLGSSRFTPPDLLESATQVLRWQVLQPLVGADATEELMYSLWGTLGIRSWESASANLVSALSIVAVFVILVFWNREALQLAFAVAFASVSIFTLVGSLGGVAGARYAVLPSFILAVMLLNNVHLLTDDTRGACARLCGVFCTLLLLMSLATGVRNYCKLDKWVGYQEGAPLWREEVKEWREGSTTRLRVFGGEFFLPPPNPEAGSRLIETGREGR